MPTHTQCTPRKPRPDIRAGLLRIRRRILSEGIRQVYAVGPSECLRCSDRAHAAMICHARAWGNIGDEWDVVEYAVLGDQCVCSFRQRFLVEVMP